MTHALCVTYGRSTVYYFSVFVPLLYHPDHWGKSQYICYTKLKNSDMKYEISGFDDVFENKNFIQLREVPQFLRETTLVVWVRWRQIFYIAKLCSSLLCEWSFCFSLHRTVCYECRSILQMDTVMYLVISFFLLSTLPSARVQQECV